MIAPTYFVQQRFTINQITFAIAFINELPTPWPDLRKWTITTILWQNSRISLAINRPYFNPNSAVLLIGQCTRHVHTCNLTIKSDSVLYSARVFFSSHLDQNFQFKILTDSYGLQIWYHYWLIGNKTSWDTVLSVIDHTRQWLHKSGLRFGVVWFF